MEFYFHFLAIVCFVSIIVQSVDSFTTVPVVKERHVAAARTPTAGLFKRQSEHFPNFEENNDFWFTRNFSVGDAHNLTLLIDSGSSDIVLNKGVYKPSPNSHTYMPDPVLNITYGSASTNGLTRLTVLGNVVTDVVKFGKFNVQHQAVGIVQNVSPKRSVAFPGGDGIIGFATRAGSAFNATPWFYNLCQQKAISECRFGLAYGTNKEGVQVLGGTDKNLYNGNLTIVPTHPEFGPTWTIYGDLTINNAIKYPSQILVMDSGTSNILGPAPIIHQIFTTLGFQIINSTVPIYGSIIKGYFPCDKPPSIPIGLRFPSQSELAHPPSNASSITSKKPSTINILPSQWAFQDNGHNNCTAVMTGLPDVPGEVSAWLLGQPFFQGHYVDFNPGMNYTMGFAGLKRPHDVPGSR